MATIDLVGDNREFEVWGLILRMHNFMWVTLKEGKVYTDGCSGYQEYEPPSLYLVNIRNLLLLMSYDVWFQVWKNWKPKFYNNNQYEPACEILSLLDF